MSLSFFLLPGAKSKLPSQSSTSTAFTSPNNREPPRRNNPVLQVALDRFRGGVGASAGFLFLPVLRQLFHALGAIFLSEAQALNLFPRLGLLCRTRSNTAKINPTFPTKRSHPSVRA